jgi:hypothetical protein
MDFGIRAFVVISLSVHPGMFGQSKSDRPVKPITVCEVLGDLPKYSGKDFAIMGRVDCGSSFIDRTFFLAEDQCERPVTTDGYSWPTKIMIVDYWDEGMPKPPSAKPHIDEPTLIDKLSLLRKTTKLGLHREALFKTEGPTFTFSHFADVKDEWGVAYGKVFNALKLGWDNSCAEAGCRGLDGAPAALIINRDSLRAFRDDAYPNQTPPK